MTVQKKCVYCDAYITSNDRIWQIHGLLKVGLMASDSRFNADPDNISFGRLLEVALELVEDAAELAELEAKASSDSSPRPERDG